MTDLANAVWGLIAFIFMLLFMLSVLALGAAYATQVYCGVSPTCDTPAER
jgi:hypothetical protein